MSEQPFNPGDQHAELPPAQDAIWHSPEGDIPVKIVGGKVKDGKPHVILEDNKAVPEDQVDKIQSPTNIPDVEGGESQDTDEQYAKLKVQEYLNARQKRTNDIAQIKGNGDLYDSLIKEYEALREAAKQGNFSNKISYKYLDEGETHEGFSSVISFMNEEVQNLSDLAVELSDKNDPESKKELDKVHELYDQAEEALIALEKAHPNISEQFKESQAKEKQDVKKPKPNFKFKKHEKVTIKSRDRKREFEWQVNVSFVGKGEKVYVRVIDPNGKFPERVIPQEQLEEWNPRQAQTPDSHKTKTNQPSESKNNDAMANYGNNGGKDVDNSKPNKINGPNDTWLDPRRIQSLKDQYKDLLVKEKYYTEKVFTTKDEKGELRHTMSNKPPMSEFYKDIVKTHLIEREIRRAIKLAESAGKTLEMPSDEIKLEMATMLDSSDTELAKLANEMDEKLANEPRKFKPGQKVNIVSYDGSVSDNWTVESVQKHYRHGDVGVWISNGREKRWYSADKLLEFQDAANPDVKKEQLEKLKPYFNSNVKVKIGDRVIDAKFGGVSTHGDGGVYVDTGMGEPVLNQFKQPVTYGDGTPMHKYELIKDIDEFLSWQSLKSEADIAAEQAAKLERINREVPEEERKFQLGQEVKRIQGDNVLEGYIVDDFKKEGDDIIVRLIKGNEVGEVEQDLLEHWQLIPDGTAPNVGGNSESDDTGANTDNPDTTDGQTESGAQQGSEPQGETEEQRLEREEKEAKEWREAKLAAKSWWEKTKDKKNSLEKWFEGGNTEEDKKYRKKMKRLTYGAGIVAVGAFGWNIGAGPAALTGATLFIQHQWRKLDKKAVKKAFQIEEEKDRKENARKKKN